jgi:phage recombination protein Bet
MTAVIVKENVAIGSVSCIDSRKELLKRTICKGATDDELELFGMVCKKTGLDPFMKQIYPVKRWSNSEKREVMTLQTSIDGFRLIAERTGNYSPGREPTFTYDSHGKMLSATSYVKKRTSDGTWHEVAASAYFQEYVQLKKDGTMMQFWEKMPHVMLAKCAESLALRKAFPAELSGLYTSEEMSQATPHEEKTLSEEQVKTINDLMSQINDDQYFFNLQDFLKVETIYDIKPKDFERLVRSLEKKIKETRKEADESSAVA